MDLRRHFYFIFQITTSLVLYQSWLVLFFMNNSCLERMMVAYGWCGLSIKVGCFGFGFNKHAPTLAIFLWSLLIPLKKSLMQKCRMGLWSLRSCMVVSSKTNWSSHACLAFKPKVYYNIVLQMTDYKSTKIGQLLV